MLPNLATVNPDANQPAPSVTLEEKKEILHSYGLTSLSIATVYRWLKAMGFKYEVRKKFFFGRARKAWNEKTS